MNGQIRNSQINNVLLYAYIILMSTGIGYRQLGGLSFIILALLGLLNIDKIIRPRVLAPFLFFIIFVGIKTVLIDNYLGYSDFFSVHTYLRGLLGFCFTALVLPKCFNEKNKKNAIYIFLLCFSLTLIYSIAILFRHGNSVYRQSLDSNFVFMAPQNFIFYSLLLASAIFFLTMNKKINLFIGVLFLIINLIFLFVSGYTIQVLVALLCMLLTGVFQLLKNKNKSFFFVPMLILLVFILVIYRIQFVVFLRDFVFSNNNQISSRINEIYLFLIGDRTSSFDLNSRINLMEISLGTFKDNFLFGISFSNYNNIVINIGSHSQWVDDLGRLGVAGILFWFIFLISIVKSSFKLSNSFIKSALITIFIYGFLNPLASSAFFAIFVISYHLSNMDGLFKKAVVIKKHIIRRKSNEKYFSDNSCRIV